MGLSIVVHVLASLAVYRVCRMVARENGPFGVFFQVRRRAAAFFVGTKDEPSPHITRWGWVAEGVTCSACLSVWVGLAAALVVGAPLWYGLAYSGAAVWLSSLERA